MKYLNPGFPIAIALIILAPGYTLEHAAAEQGGAMLRGLLPVIFAAMMGLN